MGQPSATGDPLALRVRSFLCGTFPLKFPCIEACWTICPARSEPSAGHQQKSAGHVPGGYSQVQFEEGYGAPLFVDDAANAGGQTLGCQETQGEDTVGGVEEATSSDGVSVGGCQIGECSTCVC